MSAELIKLQEGLIIAIVVMNLVLAFLVISKNRKSELHKSFFLFIMFITGWILSIYFLQQTASILWGKMGFIFGSLMPGAFLWFAIVFPESNKKANKLLVMLALLIPFIFTILPSDYLFQNQRIESGSIIADNGFLLPYFSAICVILALIGLYIMIRDYLNAKGIARVQFQFVLWGLVFFTITAMLSNVILPAFGIYTFNSIGPVFSIILIGAITYAILKRHLLDIKLIATEVLVFLLVIVSIVQFFLSHSLTEYIINGLILVAIIYIGYYLIQSVRHEIKRRRELQELTQELKSANKRLAELDALKTEFVSMASHELLTPISAIQGYLHMILDEKILPLTDPRTEEILRKVHGSSDRLARLVMDLLNVSRIESGRIVMEKQAFDINQVIQIAISELKVKATEKNLKLLWSPQVHLKVYADKDKIKQVLNNVVGNAIKYTEKGQIEIITLVKKNQLLGTKLEGSGNSIKRIDQKGDFVAVQIKDSGVGIPKEELGNIFQKFHRIGDWKTRNTQGTGLGLYIAKNIIEMLGGKIWVESEYGHGSIFSFSVPIAKDDIIKKDNNSD